MKKLFVMILSIAMLIGLSACGSKEGSVSDSEYVKEKGTLVVGITDFAPMDYKDDNGEWIGFDADMAKAFAESLGVEAEFIEIDWDNKILELNSKNIDCVWNGMTLTEEVVSSMNTSNAYSNNSQVVVVKQKNVNDYQTQDGLVGKNIAIEAGSAGQEVLTDSGIEVNEVIEKGTQAEALMEVQAGTADACIIDYAMAKAMTGEGTSYPELVNTISLNDELYGVGFRLDSDLAALLNDFFVQAYQDGTMLNLAEKYGIADTIIEQQ